MRPLLIITLSFMLVTGASAGAQENYEMMVRAVAAHAQKSPGGCYSAEGVEACSEFGDGHLWVLSAVGRRDHLCAVAKIFGISSDWKDGSFRCVPVVREMLDTQTAHSIDSLFAGLLKRLYDALPPSEKGKPA